MDVAVTYSLIRDYFLLQCVTIPNSPQYLECQFFSNSSLFLLFCCSSSTDIVVLRA